MEIWKKQTKAIKKINPNAEFTIKESDLSTIQWYNDTTPISVADIEAQYPTVEFEDAMENLRAKRNALLQETDYHGVSDMTMSSEMTTYRQELRDITNGLTTVEDVNSVTWPTKPGA